MIRINFEDLRRRKAYEEKRKIPLREVAEQTGLTLAAVHKISTGEMDSIRFSTLEAMCHYFGLSSVADFMELKPGDAPVSEG